MYAMLRYYITAYARRAFLMLFDADAVPPRLAIKYHDYS